MRLPRILIAIGLGVTGGAVVAIQPVSAVITQQQAIHEYFVQRDLAWYGDEHTTSLTSYRSSTKVAPQAREHLDQWKSIADSTRAELGLTASAVDTHTDSLTQGQRCPGLSPVLTNKSWLFRTSTWTDLGWNAASLGDSSIGDEYEVCVITYNSGVNGIINQIKSVKLLPPPAYSEPDIPDPALNPTAMGLHPASTDRNAAKAQQLKGTTERPLRTAPGANPSINTVHAFNRGAAAQYGLNWSDGDYIDGVDVIRPDFNPAYPKLDNDCTNFVSQVLRAGGWNLRDGFDPDEPANWTYDLYGPRGPSKSWSRAAWLFNFAINTSVRAYSLGEASGDNDWNNIWDLQPGDMVFIDWDPDYAIDHALVIVGRDTFLGFTEPTVSQHSNHRHNLPMSTYIKMAALTSGSMTFWPVVPYMFYSE